VIGVPAKSKSRYSKVSVFLEEQTSGVTRYFDAIWRVVNKLEDGTAMVKYMGGWRRVNDYQTGYDYIVVR
jgi:hypothetical protein